MPAPIVRAVPKAPNATPSTTCRTRPDMGPLMGLSPILADERQPGERALSMLDVRAASLHGRCAR